jgi:hypothetical protein
VYLEGSSTMAEALRLLATGCWQSRTCDLKELPGSNKRHQTTLSPILGSDTALVKLHTHFHSNSHVLASILER